MNYFEHHIGDYDASTAHLSLVEDAIYHRMLRRYYRQEGPLPAAPEAVARLVRATDHLDVVKAILIEFFVLADDGWRKERCDTAIAQYHLKSGKASNSAKARWANVKQECERNADAVPTHSERNAHQTPITKHQSPEKQKHVAASRFGEFWSAYPEKKGRAAAEKAWKRKGLDAIADQILAHVRRMQAEDDGWAQGYIPHGSTYVNGERWHDEPKRKPQRGPQQQQPSKRMQGLMALQEMGNGLAETRDRPGLPETQLLGFGPGAGVGHDYGNGDGMD